MYEDEIDKVIKFRSDLVNTTEVDTEPSQISKLTRVDTSSAFVHRGGPVKNYRQVISRGLNATTNMSGSIVTLDSTDGNCYWQRERPNPPPTAVTYHLKYSSQGSMCYHPLPNFNLDMDLTRASNQALTRLYNNVQAVDTKFQGLVFAGELRKSLSMILSPAKSLRRGIGDYLRYLKKEAPRVAKRNRKAFVRRSWLEYSFGWVPLISDIDKGIKAFYSSDVVKPIFQMVKGSGRDRRNLSSEVITDTHGPLTWSYNLDKWEECFVQYYGTYHSNGAGISNSHSFGFTPSEFLPTVWELIPYSFLVDYFTNIGDIVSSWSYRWHSLAWSARLDRRMGVQSTSNETLDTSFTPFSPYVFTIKGHPGHMAWTKTDFTRTASVVLSVPSLELQVPGFGTKWVNILALSANLSSTRRSLAR